MTIDEIRGLKDDFLGPMTVASAMKMSTDKFIEYARTGQLPFPVDAPNVKGARVRVSRIAFLNWFDGKKQEDKTDEIVDQMKEMNRQLAIMNLLLTSAVSKYAPAFLAIFNDQIKELENR